MKIWEMVKSLEEKLEKPKRAEYLWVIEFENRAGGLSYIDPSEHTEDALRKLRWVNESNFPVPNSARLVKFKRE